MCEAADTRARLLRVCEPAACLYLLHPSPSLLSHKASAPFPRAGVLSGDSSSGTHVPSFWHWPWVIEMQTENTVNQMGSKSSKYLAKTFFFFRWWSRSVYGRWNKVRADGHSVRRAFIWTVRKSNKSRQRYLWKEERKGWGWLFNLLSLKKWTKGRPEEERAHDYSSSNQYSEKWVSLQDSFPPVKPHITQWNSVMSGSVSVTDPLRVAQAEPG